VQGGLCKRQRHGDLERGWGGGGGGGGKRDERDGKVEPENTSIN